MGSGSWAARCLLREAFQHLRWNWQSRADQQASATPCASGTQWDAGGLCTVLLHPVLRDDEEYSFGVGCSSAAERRDRDSCLSLYHAQSLGLQFVFTDAHAYPHWAGYYSDLTQLDKIDWEILQRRDFKRDPDDPRKMERYQAEALIHGHVPVAALLGIVCYNEALKGRVDKEVQQRRLNLPVYARPGWYF